jgi:hypothetical protein
MKGDERFNVTVTTTKAIKGDHIVYCYGLDERGWEVIWTRPASEWEALAAHAVKGDMLTVWGSDIYAYGGESGPWGPSMPPVRKESNDDD